VSSAIISDSEQASDRQFRYPGPALRMLELLQEDQFRQAMINPLMPQQLKQEGFEAATAGFSK
jgi:hypothetical protein